ncbi:MAG: copper homeostasis protein CutC [Clostridiales bacterium]|nr:copper homeostasis protein CutC [Clostridiales bacterium]
MVEICAGSYEDCVRAARGGADRVELNCALALGGLTPTLATLKRVKADTGLKVICMVRPRGGGFCYSDEEAELMLDDAWMLMQHGADGIAFGFLNKSGEPEQKYTDRMVRLIHRSGGEAVFHRAFDVCKEPCLTMEHLIALGVDRVLTSGQRERAVDGRKLIKELQQKYGDWIEILAGSGVNAENAAQLIAETGVAQVHSSCRAYRTDVTTRNESVSYAYLGEPHEMDYEIVSQELVKKLVAAVRA